MPASTGLVADQLPGWLGPVLVGVGLIAWVGSGASAELGSSAQPPSATPSPATPPVETTEREPEPEATPEPEPEATAEPVVELEVMPEREPEPCAESIELTFGSGAAGLDQPDLLQGFLGVAERFPDHKIVVEGYASAEGSEAANLRLSFRRAARVKALLVEEGIDAERIVPQAFGEYRLTLDGDEERDRRVVIRIQDVETCPKRTPEEG